MRLYDRTLWILYNHHGFGNEYQRPYATCQYGLAEEFGTSRGTIAHVICEMEQDGLVEYRRVHVGKKTKMFSYDLTPTGMERAEEVIRKYGGDPTVFRTPTKVTAE